MALAVNVICCPAWGKDGLNVKLAERVEVVTVTVCELVAMF